MRQKQCLRGRRTRQTNQQGTIIVLVAVFMLFVVGAMAALSIDVTTMYTARSEAQLVADSAALAAARVLANSGATSDTSGASMAAVTAPGGTAYKVAIQVAQSSMVGGRYLVASAGEVTVGFAGSGCVATSPITNPCVSVKIQRTDLPTFFARLLGRTTVAVSASATAEAYNPSGVGGAAAGTPPPVAPLCVKPWLLPNKDPSSPGGQIFSPSTGAILSTTLLGWNSGGVPLTSACSTGANLNGACGPLPSSTTAWQYFPGEDSPLQFPHPTSAHPTCNPALTHPYQESVAGCIQIPISCSSLSATPANIDFAAYPVPGRDSDTTDAVTCLTHTTNNEGDKVTGPPPFEFIAGADNPVAVEHPFLAAQSVMVSDSLVTVPVFDDTGYNSGWTNVPIIGFVQLFLNPDGKPTPAVGAVNTTVINLAGCGPNITTAPIVGNGASPVAVRLISQ
jgi:Flp pilus assembly protein TadG